MAGFGPVESDVIAQGLIRRQVIIVSHQNECRSNPRSDPLHFWWYTGITLVGLARYEKMLTRCTLRTV
jgi:hypothetical protein